jgi:hypothetical protein
MARRARWRRVLVNPVASLALAAVLVADLLCLPDSVYRGGWSTAGRVTSLLLGRPLPQGHPPMGDFIAVREPTGFRRLHPEDDSWDETTRLLAQRPQDMMLFYAVYLEGASGLWAPTRHSRTIRLDSTVGSAVPKKDADALRDQFLDEFGVPSRFGAASLATLIATGTVTESEPVWIGYAHDALALAAFILFVVSLRWVSLGPWSRSARRARALAQERCPRCGYSIRDLPQPKCPECGEVLDWPVRAAAPP